MASILPNMPGTGSKIPINNYTAGITDFYPNVNRKRLVETSINSRERVDIMPINSGLNQTLSDKYIEFRIKSSEGVFLDMASLALEMKMTFDKDGGFKGTEKDDLFTLVNGISNTLFKSVNVFLNDKLVESSPLYNYVSYIKLLRTTPLSTIDSLGACGRLRDDYYYSTPLGGGICDTYNEQNIQKKDCSDLQSTGVDVCFPLCLDIASLDMYLVDNVDVRVRLELANKSWYMGYVGAHSITSHIQKATLWVDKVIPHFNAMKALFKNNL